MFQPVDSAEYFNKWWRFSAYERLGHHIVPAAGAKLEIYNPWEAYYAIRRTKGGGARTPPYLRLLALADAIRGYRGVAAKDLDGSPLNASIVEWYQENGPLGIFCMRVKQIHLYPRWKLENGHLVGCQRILVQHPTHWSGRPVYLSDNPEALALPDDQKPINSLVPLKYWDRRWEKPGVLLRDTETGLYWHTSLSEGIGGFFPSVDFAERETFEYPVPTSEEFWRAYGEDQDVFMNLAFKFSDDVRTLTGSKPADQLTDSDKRKLNNAMRSLQALAAHTSAGLYPNEDGSYVHQWVPGSLLASYAMMVLLDLSQGLINACENCKRIFVSSASRAKFCSGKCRKTVLQREWRNRKAASGVWLRG